MHINSDKDGNVEALFRKHFEPMCRLAFKFINDFDSGKDIVHEVFISFWNKYDSLPSDTNYKSYLYTAVRNKSFNYLRDNKKHINIIDAENEKAPQAGQSIETKELSNEINLALNLLPNRCREIFELSRFEDMKYTQIASHLGISIKTVETQMGKALRLLREHLKEFLTFVIIILVLT